MTQQPPYNPNAVYDTYEQPTYAPAQPYVAPSQPYGAPQQPYVPPVGPDMAYGTGYAQNDQFVEVNQGEKTSIEGERFSQQSKYRDIVFALLFVAHLVVLVIITITSGNSGSSSSGTGTSTMPLIPHDQIGTLAAILVVVGVVGLLVSAAWIAFFKRYAKQLIIFTMIMSIVAFAVGSVVMFAMGNVLGGVIFAFMALLNGVFYFFWRRRIPFAAAMLHAVGNLVQTYPQTVLVAFGGIIVGILFLVLWSYTVALSAGNLDNGYFVQAFLLLSVYWTMQVIKNVVHVTVSGTFASWYFLQGTSSMPPRPIMGALRRAVTYSFGSICLGSLLVAIIKLIRAAVRSARRENNALACIADCLLGCLDRLVQYFNTYAFVQVAMYGKSFVEAAKATWNLVKRRGWDAIINDNLIDGVLIMGCCIGGIVTAVVGGGWAYAKIPSTWPYIAFLSFIIGFAMVMVVMEIVESGVVTLFVCLAEEPHILKERNPELYQKFQETWNLDLK